ncbi:hypothetical protein D3C78_1137870 [compost metagenome]
MGSTRLLVVCLEGETRQASLVPLRNLALLRDDSAGPFDLGKSDRRADIGHPIIERQHVVPVLPRAGNALILQVAGAAEHGFVLRDNHPAFAGGDGLVAEETECGDVAEGPDMLPFVQGAESLRTILDEEQVMLPADGGDLVHFAGQSV